jgi:predicted acyltransferase
MASSARMSAVDSLRGVAVLGMSLSGMVAYKGLPAWMYHAQLPPPTRDFNPKVYGITWVDLVFPFFLFALGVAIPLSVGIQIERRLVTWRVMMNLLVRAFNLAAFALIGQHLRPGNITKSPDQITFWLVLASFFAIGLMFFKAKGWIRIALNVLGWVGAIALVLHFYGGGKTFDWGNCDIIIMVLANVALSAGAIWYFTRNSLQARFACMAVVACVFLTTSMPGIGKSIWDWHPLPVGYFFQPEYHKYLLIAIPGTAVGDILRRRIVFANDGLVWSVPTDIGLVAGGIAASTVACVGLLAREITLTFFGLSSISLFMVWLSRRSNNPTEERIRQISRWGASLVLIGLLLEPLSGGIRKDSPTLSYFFLTAGLACLALISFLIAHEKWDMKLRLLTGTGANPILGYTAIITLVPAISGLLGLESMVGTYNQEQFAGNPWGVVIWAGIKTLFIGIVCLLATRNRWFMRA